MTNRTDGPRSQAFRVAAALGCALLGGPMALAAPGKDLTVRRPHPAARAPVVPSPLLPGAPIPWSGSPVLTPQTLSIVDEETRFLTAGPAQDRCPRQPVVFVPGVVNAFRPTLPGDGAFMCRTDAIAEGFVGP